MTTPPPSPASAHLDAATRQLVRIGAWIVAATGSGIALMLLLEPEPMWRHVALNATVGAVGMLVLVLGWRGHEVAAARTLVWGVWCMVTLVAASNGGLRGPNLLNFPVLIVFSGWLLGVRATLWLTGATALVFAGFLVADVRHWLPSAHYGNRWAYAMYLAGILSVTASATLLSRRSYLRRAAEAQETASHLAASEAELRKLSQAVEQSPESVVITDLQGRIEYVNAAYLARTGYTRSEVLGQISEAFIHYHGPSMAVQGETQDEVHSHFGVASQQDAGGASTFGVHSMLGEVPAEASGHRNDSWAQEQLVLRKDGSELLELVRVAPIRAADDSISHFVELKQDITERKRVADEVRRLTHLDALTGLPNRAMLVERLHMMQAVAARRPRGGEVFHALLLLDIDRFTGFNDARGNEMGDRLLCAVALRLSQVLPAQGLVVRVAGDEFGVLLCDLGYDAAQASRHAMAFAEVMQEQLQQGLRLDGDTEEIALRASVGITLYPQGPDDDGQEALRRGGTALHQAKQLGGGALAFFEQGMGEMAAKRFAIERELRQGIAAGELRVYLQSQIDGQGALMGAELLVRWQHPRDGLVQPGVFIPVAEESDLIIALGDWVLERACQLLAHPVVRARRLRLSVNLSARQLAERGFVSRLQTLLARAGCDPTLLTLEVTEGVVIDDFDAALNTMHALHVLGVEFALDDFGTGYSSLSYLKRLPIQELKIDRSFVHEAPTNADDGVLVDSILSVARHFGLRVVAEGVETELQASFLRQRAPSVICQGFLYARPVPEAQWLAQLEAMSPQVSGTAAV